MTKGEGSAHFNMGGYGWTEPSISQRELVFHVPNYRVINAAFTHPNPLGARFSTPERGAWYAAFEPATAKAEDSFHKIFEVAEIDWKERQEIGYDDYLADFTAAFHNLRGLVDEAPQRCWQCAQEHRLPAHLDAASGPLCPAVTRVSVHGPLHVVTANVVQGRRPPGFPAIHAYPMQGSRTAQKYGSIGLLIGI